jgi:hypothetical protein
MLDEYMKSLGYNDKEIDRIRNAYVLRRYTDIVFNRSHAGYSAPCAARQEH